MQKYVFIDESGDLGSQSQHLIISALVVDNPSHLERIIKNMRRNKFKKQLRKSKEIKANNSSKDLRIHMLQKLSEVPNVKAYHIVLKKSKNKSNFLKENKNKLYNYVAGQLAKHFCFEGGVNLEIRVDKSKGRQVLQQDFNEYFKRKLQETSHLGKVDIYHSHSEAWCGLQFADMLAWSMFQKHESNNGEYVEHCNIPHNSFECWGEKN